jgi:phosphoribosylanthranilate isomerase
MSVGVKLCGVKDDASLAAVLAVSPDFVGFVHAEKSPRHVSVAQAAALIAELPVQVRSVMVLVNPDDALLASLVREAHPDMFQLHGHETPARLRDIRRTYPTIGLIKALPVSTVQDVLLAQSFHGVADYVLFDAKPPKDSEIPGGNGISFDWNILAGQQLPMQWFLSGGLHAGNVAEAVRSSGAQLVDTSSGIESAPGVKDAGRVQEFVAALRAGA